MARSGLTAASGIAARIIAGGALAFMMALLVYAAGRPIDNNDFWWHLAMGEIFATNGPWLESDPLTHTAKSGPPSSHEWLFEVAIHGLEEQVGLQGLRVVHVLLVLGIVQLAFSLFRRESGSGVAASAATSVFILLSWWRLNQFRPDLVSIPATLLMYRLLLEPDAAPSWKRVAAAVVLLVFWANSHALFAIGLCLIIAALLGWVLHALLTMMIAGRGLVGDGMGAARRLSAALGIGLLATLMNPEGLTQHFAFLRSSQESTIWTLVDEWSPFSPIAWDPIVGGVDRSAALSLPAWIAMDSILVLFTLATGVWATRLARSSSPDEPRPGDAALFGLGLAGITAVLVSIRFLWLAALPLLFVLRFCRRAVEQRGALVTPLTWGLAAAGVAIALALPLTGGFEQVVAGAPPLFDGYFSQAYATNRRLTTGVRFLADTGVEGNLFNPPPVGGAVSYWTRARVRTFLDGRMNSPEDAYEDHRNVNVQRGTRPGENFTDVLDRREVDLFFGWGLPTARQREGPNTYTTANLERADGWLLVSRSRHHGLYLRADTRNRKNLQRVVDYYAREGVPFDPDRGLDVVDVVRERPDWAIEHKILPPHYAELMAERTSSDLGARFAALNSLGRSFALVGAYEEQIKADSEAAGLHPTAKAPRRRLVIGHLRLDHSDEALEAARELSRIDPTDPLSAKLLRVAREYLQRERGGRRNDLSLDASLNSLPWLDGPR
jgi:hypothetical protein